MTVLDMDAATLPADAKALYETMAARRKTKGEGFGGPYVALLNHPELARRIEELGFFLKFEGALPRTIYQFIVLTIARATGAAYEWHDHIAHARAAGLPEEVIDCIGSARTGALASEASGQRANSVVRAHSASEDARKRADDTRPEPGSSARATLVLAVQRLCALADACGNDRARFLDAVTLTTDAEFFDPRADRVSLLTLHAAKGLEFPVVFIAGLEDGLLPLYWGDPDQAALEEERRLFYVGMTRAKDKLILSRAEQRHWRGALRRLEPSPFLRDIEAELTKHQRMEPVRRKPQDRQLKLF